MRDAKQAILTALDQSEDSSLTPINDRAVARAQVHAIADAADGLHRIAEALYALAPGYDYPIARDPVRWQAVRPQDLQPSDLGKAVIVRSTSRDDDGWHGTLRTYEHQEGAWVFTITAPDGVLHSVTILTEDCLVVDVFRG